MLEVHSGVCKDSDVGHRGRGGHRGREGDGKKRKSINLIMQLQTSLNAWLLTVYVIINNFSVLLVYGY